MTAHSQHLSQFSDMTYTTAQLVVLVLPALLACARAAGPQRVVAFLPFWSQASALRRDTCAVSKGSSSGTADFPRS